MEAMWKNADPTEVQSVWRDELSQFQPSDIREALEALRYHCEDWPPTLYQFASLCRDAKRKRVQPKALSYGKRDPIPETFRAKVDKMLKAKVVR